LQSKYNKLNLSCGLEIAELKEEDMFIVY